MKAALWQRPRPARPTSFDLRVAQLHQQIEAIGRDHRAAALASSLSAEDVVITHVIAATGASIDVFVIDTGRLHPHTLELRREVERQFNVPLRVYSPQPAPVARHVAEHGAFAFYDSVEQRHACCHLRKVEPLERALAGRDAWLTGQRRAHGPERERLAEEELDVARGIAKFNPLALWSDEDIWHYVDFHNLPVNPLYDAGYPSIGCEPCTRPIRAGEDPRAGRWWWEAAAAKECGLHVVHDRRRIAIAAGATGEDQPTAARAA